MQYDVFGNSENEIWKDIEGYEGLYQVSNHGRIRTLPRYKQLYNKRVFINGGFMSLNHDKDGYFIVTLSKNGKKKTKRVHRLVAQAFIPNPNNKANIDHIDCNKTNNKVDNLRWVTTLENNRYCVINGNHYNPTLGKYGKENPLSKKIYRYTKDGKFVDVWYCAEDLAKHLGCSRKSIGACCRRKFKTCRGYILRYENNIE